MPVCGDCGGTTIEYDIAAGNSVCIQCGTVVEENTIVAEVTFGETATGAAMVQGAYVGQGETRARMTGPGGYRGSGESREQTLLNARRKILQVCAALNISTHLGEEAHRWYTLAVGHRFTKGRRSELVVAVCLYVACRRNETSHMLIDFSDVLQVNVFVLGMTYLRLVQTLNIRLPLIDPACYIHRFAALLEFGDETGKVANDAMRLVKRFNRDWMTAGRRPAGICGASLLLAARMNNFRRSIQEIVQVVKIADVTLKKRIEEFRRTSSGNLTVADFRKVWLEEEMDPPAFTRGKEQKSKARAKENVRKGKRKKGDGSSSEYSEEDSEVGEGDKVENASGSRKKSPIDPALLDRGILAGTQRTNNGVGASPLFLPDPEDNQSEDDKDDTDKDEEVDNTAIDPRLLELSDLTYLPHQQELPPISELDETLDTFLTEEVSEFIENEQGLLLKEALDMAEQRQQALIEIDDELLGLNEDELDHMILTEDEVKIKERIWVELNRDYLENLAAKALREQNGEINGPKPRKRRKVKGNNKPRDASNAHGSTPAESLRNFVTKNKKFSRKINYSAYDSLFGTNSGPIDIGQNKELDDEGLYHMDDKSDGEPLMVVEEEGGGVGIRRALHSRATTGRGPQTTLDVTLAYGDNDQDAEGEKDDETWGAADDAEIYEQEI